MATSFPVVGVVTGRLSSTHPNMSNGPRSDPDAWDGNWTELSMMDLFTMTDIQLKTIEQFEILVEAEATRRGFNYFPFGLRTNGERVRRRAYITGLKANVQFSLCVDTQGAIELVASAPQVAGPTVTHRPVVMFIAAGNYGHLTLGIRTFCEQWLD